MRNTCWECWNVKMDISRTIYFPCDSILPILGISYDGNPQDEWWNWETRIILTTLGFLYVLLVTCEHHSKAYFMVRTVKGIAKRKLKNLLAEVFGCSSNGRCGRPDYGFLTGNWFLHIFPFDYWWWFGCSPDNWCGTLFQNLLEEDFKWKRWSSDHEEFKWKWKSLMKPIWVELALCLAKSVQHLKGISWRQNESMD